MFRFRLVISSLFILFLTACSSLPQELVSSNEHITTDYQQWLAISPDQPVEVRLGGMIADVTNLEDRSRIEIVNMPIDKAGKPDLKKEPQGRYVVYVDGYVESMSFTPGRLITVIGMSAGEEKGKVDEFDYTFRVIHARATHLWTIQESIIIDDIGSYMYPCRHGLHCRTKRMTTNRGRVVQEVR